MGQSHRHSFRFFMGAALRAPLAVALSHGERAVTYGALAGSIDAFAFEDTDGARWLFWKNDGNARGLDTSIWVQRLSADGTRLEGAPVDTGLRQTPAQIVSAAVQEDVDAMNAPAAVTGAG